MDTRFLSCEPVNFTSTLPIDAAVNSGAKKCGKEKKPDANLVSRLSLK
jgi:hypothetical protein